MIAKLALGDVNVAWRLVSRNHFVQFTAKARPPARVLFRDPAVRDGDRAGQGVPAGDRPRRRRPRRSGVDLDSESPHMAVSAGTGAGKSNMLRVVAAQLMHHGASLVILDLKRRSHRWAKGLDGVTYCREVAEIHRALCRAGGRGDGAQRPGRQLRRRHRAAVAAAGGDHGGAELHDGGADRLLAGRAGRAGRVAGGARPTARSCSWAGPCRSIC